MIALSRTARRAAVATLVALLAIPNGRGLASEPDREALAKDCSNNRGAACMELAKAWYLGLNGPASTPKAVTYFRKACDLKVAKACYELAVAYEGHSGVEASEELRLAALTDGCNLNDALACNEAAGLLQQNWESQVQSGRPPKCECMPADRCRKGASKCDITRAVEMYDQACSLGMGLACLSASTVWMSFGRMGDAEQRAVNYLVKGCKNKLAYSCFLVAKTKQTGYDSRLKIKGTGDDWYRAACDLGHGLSCWTLARPDEWLTMTSKAREQSIALLKKGCIQGLDVLSCQTLSYYVLNEYWDGETQVRGDWREKGCELGDGGCCEMVGMFVGEQTEEAHQFFVAGCRLGHGDSCLRVGMQYAGSERPQDLDIGMAYVTAACDMGSVFACILLQGL